MRKEGVVSILNVLGELSKIRVKKNLLVFSKKKVIGDFIRRN